MGETYSKEINFESLRFEPNTVLNVLMPDGREAKWGGAQFRVASGRLVDTNLQNTHF